MNRPVRLTIDRLVLTDLPLSRGRAERLRTLVEAELSRLVAAQDWSSAATPLELRRVEAAPLSAAQLSNDTRLATSIAGRIFQTLPGPVGGPTKGDPAYKAHIQET